MIRVHQSNSPLTGRLNIEVISSVEYSRGTPDNDNFEFGIYVDDRGNVSIHLHGNFEDALSIDNAEVLAADFVAAVRVARKVQQLPLSSEKLAAAQAAKQEFDRRVREATTPIWKELGFREQQLRTEAFAEMKAQLEATDWAAVVSPDSPNDGGIE